MNTSHYPQVWLYGILNSKQYDAIPYFWNIKQWHIQSSLVVGKFDMVGKAHPTWLYGLPELNPIEQIWANIKRDTQGVLPCKSDFIDVLVSCSYFN